MWRQESGKEPYGNPLQRLSHVHVYGAPFVPKLGKMVWYIKEDGGICGGKNLLEFLTGIRLVMFPYIFGAELEDSF